MQCIETRETLVLFAGRLADSPLGVGTSGNLSLRDTASGLVVITPSAMDYDDLTAADMVLLTPDGQIAETGRRPSSEWAMHLGCYQRREDIGAVVHTHSPAATTLAVLGRQLPAVHYMIALNGTDHIPLAPYHPFGTQALAEAAVACMGEGWACLLANHGVLAAGPDLQAAWDLAEHIEFCADIYLRALQVGNPNILDRGQIDEVVARLGAYARQD